MTGRRTARSADPLVSRVLSAPVGALAEAWAELRTHKLRVFLSLVGIAVAVGALTAVLAFGELQKQATIEQSDRWGGRVATISIYTSSTDGSPINWKTVDDSFAHVAERYGFSHTSRISDGMATLPVQLPKGVTPISARLMDPAYPIMHRMKIEDGRWFHASDRALLAPPVIISAALWEALGSTPLSQHPTITMTGDFAGTYPIIGVTPKDGPWDTQRTISMLIDQYRDKVGVLAGDLNVTREIWIGADAVGEIGPVLAMDLRARLPSTMQVDVSRSDWASQSGFDEQFFIMQLITGSIAGLVLLLGGLSLVNVQLVAMRQRIREVGVRRSFGATGARIFTAVMLESVVAIAVAGLVGIALAVAIMSSPFVMQNVFYGMQDIPKFPFEAALIGLGAAVAIGALAGLVPALVALRVKVIDAIRF